MLFVVVVGTRPKFYFKCVKLNLWGRAILLWHNKNINIFPTMKIIAIVGSGFIFQGKIKI